MKATSSSNKTLYPRWGGVGGDSKNDRLTLRGFETHIDWAGKCFYKIQVFRVGGEIRVL